VDLPTSGKIFLSVTGRHKEAIVPLAARLADMGYGLIATAGTAQRLSDAGIDVEIVHKLQEGHPNLLDYLANEDVQLIMNTPSGKGARTDEGRIRAACVSGGVPCITTIQAAQAVVGAMEALREEELTVQPLQDRFAFHKKSPTPVASNV
jgi:carbamoyl-phosphate synthase large subunit